MAHGIAGDKAHPRVHGVPQRGDSPSSLSPTGVMDSATAGKEKKSPKSAQWCSFTQNWACATAAATPASRESTEGSTSLCFLETIWGLLFYSTFAFTFRGGGRGRRCKPISSRRPPGNADRVPASFLQENSVPLFVQDQTDKMKRRGPSPAGPFSFLINFTD